MASLSGDGENLSQAEISVKLNFSENEK